MAHKKGGGVYQIVNNQTGDVYVGSSNCTARRWAEHKSTLRLGHHANPHLQNAWKKYGEESFRFEILETVADVSNGTALREREAHFLLSLKPQYNISESACGGKIGHKQSEETKQKIREKRTGKTHTEETKRAIGDASRLRGMPASIKDAQKAAVTGKPRPQWVRDKIAAAHRKRAAEKATR